jgi:hypothetical protein
MLKGEKQNAYSSSLSNKEVSQQKVTRRVAHEIHGLLNY